MGFWFWCWRSEKSWYEKHEVNKNWNWDEENGRWYSRELLGFWLWCWRREKRKYKKCYVNKQWTWDEEDGRWYSREFQCPTWPCIKFQCDKENWKERYSLWPGYFWLWIWTQRWEERGNWYCLKNWIQHQEWWAKGGSSTSRESSPKYGKRYSWNSSWSV